MNTLQKVLVGGAVLGVGYLFFGPKERKIRRHGWTVTDCKRFHQNNFGQWSVFMENHRAESGRVPRANTAEQIVVSAFAAAFPECPSPPDGATFTFAAAPGVSATWGELVDQVKQVWGGLEAASPLGVMFGGIE